MDTRDSAENGMRADRVGLLAMSIDRKYGLVKCANVLVDVRLPGKPFATGSRFSGMHAAGSGERHTKCTPSWAWSGVGPMGGGAVFAAEKCSPTTGSRWERHEYIIAST